MKLSIKSAIAISIFFIVTIAAFLFIAVSKTSSPEIPALQPGAASHLEPERPIGSNSNRATDSESPTITSTVRETTSAPPVLEVSESEAAIAWKQSAGIFTANEVEFYIGKSREELMQLAHQGDLVAKSWLGISLARAGEPDAAVATLKDAVTDGSIGAASTLAQLYSGLTTRNFRPDRIQSYAWYRLAQAMGDPGPMFLGLIPRKFISEEEELFAELAYFDLLTEVHAMYELKHGQPMPFNPPPIEVGEGE